MFGRNFFLKTSPSLIIFRYFSFCLNYNKSVSVILHFILEFHCSYFILVTGIGHRINLDQIQVKLQLMLNRQQYSTLFGSYHIWWLFYASHLFSYVFIFFIQKPPLSVNNFKISFVVELYEYRLPSWNFLCVQCIVD